MSHQFIEREGLTLLQVQERLILNLVKNRPNLHVEAYAKILNRPIELVEGVMKEHKIIAERKPKRKRANVKVIIDMIRYSFQHKEEFPKPMRKSIDNLQKAFLEFSEVLQDFTETQKK